MRDYPKPPHGQSTLRKILNDAYEAWNLKQLELAAELFDKAAIMQHEAAKGRVPFAAPDTSFSSAIRAAICLWDSGRHELARPYFERALTFDWVGARLYSDRHMTEWAFFRLLVERAANQDRAGFSSLWQQATLRGEQLSNPFPSGDSHQKTLLIACVSLMFEEGCRQVMSRIEPKQLGRDHELRLFHSHALKFCHSPSAQLS